LRIDYLDLRNKPLLYDIAKQVWIG